MNKGPKVFKGEKYIYLLMGYFLAKQNKGRIKIGDDNGMKGSQNFERIFTISEHEGSILLTERKTSVNFADFSRTFEVYGDMPTPTIKEYVDEAGDNHSKNWVH